MYRFLTATIAIVSIFINLYAATLYQTTYRYTPMSNLSEKVITNATQQSLFQENIGYDKAGMPIRSMTAAPHKPMPPFLLPATINLMPWGACDKSSVALAKMAKAAHPISASTLLT